MIQPALTLRSNLSPFNALSAINYVQSASGGDNLPVLQGQVSNPVLFRIYNNFALAVGIASAINVALTVFDGVGAGSHTCALLPVSQSWVRIFEHGYGENSVPTPDNLTAYQGSETAIGGSAPCGVDTYQPEVGSDGSFTEHRLRAWNNNNGVGFIEFQSMVSVPNALIVQNQTYNFSVSVVYEWFS